MFGRAATADGPFDGMDPYIEKALQKWEVPGLAIAVVKDDQVVLARGYGVCQLGTQRSVTADTVFPIASCAKSFVATAVAILVEDGKLNWDDPVVKHLPELELANRNLTENVTLRDLLCHRTGLRRADLLAYSAKFDPDVVLSRLKYLEPVAEPRTRFIYNNHMYTVLGEVVRRVSGKPWESFVAQRVFQPLAMSSTTSAVATIDPDRLARRHWRSDAGIVARPVDDGMVSTVGDMCQWLRLQLAEGKHEEHRILKPETIAEMHALQFSIPIRTRPKENPYSAQFFGSGLGWSVQDYRGRKVVSHAGAWGAIVALMPEEGLGVVVLSNLDLEYLCSLLMFDVFDAYLVGSNATWNPDKWETTWLRNEPSGAAYHSRDAARTRLENNRITGTQPSFPLENYAGAYDSKLYGPLLIGHDTDRLSATFGAYKTDLAHWQNDSFYVRSPTRLTFDWLLTFTPDGNGGIASVTVKHIGWDQDELDHEFIRSR
jgi:CubicO group peptidase (beta-lactamase class C family)